jgi:hypothetical protein
MLEFYRDPERSMHFTHGGQFAGTIWREKMKVEKYCRLAGGE